MLQKTEIILDNITIHITLKKIKNLHLRVLAPDGRVNVSAPLRIDFQKIKKFIEDRIEWIKKAQIKIRAQKFEPKKKFLNGEFHYFFGQKYLLNLVEGSGKTLVILKESEIEIKSKNLSTIKKRQKILDEFYRAEIKKIIPIYIKKWEEKMNLQVAEFGIKKMKTRWGTCNIRARRIWLNLELAKKTAECLEYIVVHEMVHLLEKNHTKKFFAHMDFFLPEWRDYKEMLKHNR